jgi:hypothetical protein
MTIEMKRRTTMTARNTKTGLWRFHAKRLTFDETRARREAAFVAIKALYRECLPLWRVCRRGACRRHHTCAGDADCLPRGWPRMPEAAQWAAFKDVQKGGPRRLSPATDNEMRLRHFPPSNFTH